MRLIAGFKALDGVSRMALVCVVFGWFFMNTVVVQFGSLQHGVPFFDMGAVITDPTRLFLGVFAPLQRFAFSLLCLACIAAPAIAHANGRGSENWPYAAPLALILACAALLYYKTSGEFFETPADAHSLAGTVMKFANDLARRGGGLVAKHLSIGAGAYLAVIGSLALAYQGFTRRSGEA